MLNRITQNNSNYTLLQQRLLYIENYPDRLWTVLVDNVPPWPNGSPIVQKHKAKHITNYGPCNGHSELIDRIQKIEKLKYDMSFSKDEILVTNGALHGLSLIFRKLFEPGSVAICLSSVLCSIYNILARIGYEILFLETQHNGSIDLDKLNRLCTNNVKLVFADMPNNPFGDILHQDTLKELLNFTEERSIALVADLIYDSFLFDNHRISNILNYNDSKENIYIVNSMSKGFGAPGLRIGWIISDKKNIMTISGILEQECVSVCSIAQEQACYMLDYGNQALVDNVIVSKSYLETLLNNIDGIKYKNPDGGTQFFIKLEVDDIDNYADYALLEHGLVLTTTSNYAGINEPYIRIPIGHPSETIKKAVELLELSQKNYLNRIS